MCLLDVYACVHFICSHMLRGPSQGSVENCAEEEGEPAVLAQ